MVLRRKEEGGDCVLLLYLSSTTHLEMREYHYQDTNSKLDLSKRLIH
jgi:hypothetical protein